MRRARLLLPVLWVGVLGFGPAVALSDELDMHSIAEEPVNAPQGVPRPAHGMTMAQVRSQFGEPAQTLDAVGEPPITRWVYEDYTVYFEHEYVLHAVVHPPKRDP